MTTSLGNKLTWYLLLGALLISALDAYLNLKRTRENLLDDIRREVRDISQTLQVTLAVSGDDAPERYFAQLAPAISHFENVLGVVFYNQRGLEVARSSSLHDRQLPPIDAHSVIATLTPIEGFFNEGSSQRYYRVEPISNSRGAGIAAFLIFEDFPVFNREFRGRMVQTLLTVLLLLVVMAIIVSVVIRRSVTAPLRMLATRIKAIGQGQFDQRLQLRRRDEIGALAEEFDRMCARLEETHQKLVAENEEKLCLERALRHSEKLAALGQISSRLAHEIGTPLNVIQMRAEQLLQRETQSDKDRAFLNVIVAQIDRISGFIRQLLALARRPEPQVRLVSLNEVVRRVWQIIGDRESVPGVELTLELCEEPSPVLGDADQLQQVLLNLAVNALQAVGETGRISIRTRVVRQNSDKIGSIECTVADTGPGIAPEHVSRLFDPFFTTKKTTGGTGLGLAISHEIILSHHGELRVESGRGQGSRFIITLPEAAQSAEPRRADEIRSQKESVAHGNT